MSLEKDCKPSPIDIQVSEINWIDIDKLLEPTIEMFEKDLEFLDLCSSNDDYLRNRDKMMALQMRINQDILTEAYEPIDRMNRKLAHYNARYTELYNLTVERVERVNSVKIWLENRRDDLIEVRDELVKKLEDLTKN